MLISSSPNPCFYINSTEDIQVIRLLDDSQHQLERVLKTGQRLVFDASSSAVLEIVSFVAGTWQAEKLPCVELKVLDLD